MANHALLSLCLLLAVAGALMATTTSAQKMPRYDDEVDRPAEPVVPPTVAACWKSIAASGSCVDDILRSLAALEVRISKVCCSVLEKIGDKCVVDAFSSFPFNPLYPPLIKHICGLTA
ncbi:hypothetical protein ACP70R_007042 [Stipagrostis hirtigluma subsp. patula]